MSDNVSPNERRLLYASLAIIILIAVYLQLSLKQLESLAAVFFLVVVAVANIMYFYTRLQTSRPVRATK
jgi:hypothetical protein